MEPPLTLRNAPKDMPVQAFISSVLRTFGWQHSTFGKYRIEVTPVPGQPPGNYALTFHPPHARDLDSWQSGPYPAMADGFARLGSLGLPAALFLVAVHDPKQRLHLFTQNGEVFASGEFHAVPLYELHLLRAPHLSTRPTLRMSSLAKCGPIEGLGPDLPIRGTSGTAGSAGGAGSGRSTCLAIAVELDSTRFNQRTGKQFKAGKAIRSWLLSWLPPVDSLDLVLLLTFWSRDMTLKEAAASSPASTSFERIVLARGLQICFPEQAPLSLEAFKELRELRHEIQRAMKSGFMQQAYLPRVEKLQAWGRTHLAEARVASGVEQPIGELPLKKYTHRQGFGAVRLKPAPRRVVQLQPQSVMQLPPQHPRRAAGGAAGPVGEGIPKVAEADASNFSRLPRGGSRLCPESRPWASTWRQCSKAVASRAYSSRTCGSGPCGALRIPSSVECVVEPPPQPPSQPPPPPPVALVATQS